MVEDLKRTRPFFAGPGNCRRVSTCTDILADSTLARVERQSNESELPESLIPETDSEAFEDYDDEDEDFSRSTHPVKTSERKRRMVAIADAYIQGVAQKSLKEEIQSGRHQVDEQSARYIVNHAESQKIISTPREYQTELFERARDRNIIAVLDTGNEIFRSAKDALTFEVPAKHLLQFSCCVTFSVKSLKIELWESKNGSPFFW